MLSRIEQLAGVLAISFCIFATSSAAKCPSVALPKVEHGCFWVAVRNQDTGCVTEYKSKCLVPMPNTASCPNMIPPERRENCAYFTIHDEQGCIVDFECEPESCKNAEDPEMIKGCVTFIPKRDPEGCVQSYSCIPVTPVALPNSLPISDVAPVKLPEVVEAVVVEEVEPFSLRADRISTKSAKADPIDLVIREFDVEPVKLLDDFKPTLNKKSAKILKDAVIIPGIKPGFGAPLARPVFASRPAVAVQPVVPLRTVVPIARPAYIPRPVIPYYPRCPRFSARRPADSDFCRWVPNRNAAGCLMGFRCVPVNLKPRIKCPRAPIKPDIGDRCNWIPVLDKNNCILKYECEPVPPEPCPPAPLPPDDHDRCKWVSIKDADNCIMDYECVPIDAPSAPHPAFTPGIGESNPLCCFWAMGGECDKNLSYMRTHCAKSCAAPGCAGFARLTCIHNLIAAGCPYSPP